MSVTQASCAEQAVETLAAMRLAGAPCRVLMVSQQTGAADGLALCRQLRGEPGYRDLIVVLFSAVTQRATSADLRAVGIDCCLSKPFRPSGLRHTLLELLDGGAGSQDLSGVSRHLPLVPRAQEEDILPFAGRRVLLVEDNRINQKLAEALLVKLGCRVDVAGNGREAVRMAAALPFDLVLMDCQMPEMDGFEATGTIRAQEGSKGRVPIIALTAAAMREDEERCLASGMDGYLSKPIRPESLRKCLANWM
jgi:CheY-like chemotaxis protein